MVACADAPDEADIDELMEPEPYPDEPDVFGFGGINFGNSSRDSDKNPQMDQQPQQLPCPPAAAPQAAQAPEQLSFAGHILHATHKMAHKRGIVWCGRCGVWSTSAPRGLREPCYGIPTRAGQAVLRRLKRGETPIARMTDWPLPSDAAPPPGRWHS